VVHSLRLFGIENNYKEQNISFQMFFEMIGIIVRSDWSTDITMIEYIENIMFGRHTSYKKQVYRTDVSSWQSNRRNNILVCYISPNMTDLLELMEFVVNKKANDFS
jgi:hypothetical protein